MHIEANLTRTVPFLVLTHNREQLEFSCKVFSKRTMENHVNVFRELNEYWASLPLHVQDSIWNLYGRVNTAFDSILSTDELFDFLQTMIVELSKLHPQDELKRLLMLSPNIKMPDSVVDDFVPDIDSKNTRGKTYTKTEYMDLLSFALFLHALVPIWGEYVQSTQQTVGKNNKAFSAVLLLNNTGVMDFPGAVRLQDYIDHLIGSKKADITKIMEGHSSEDSGFVFFAQTCFNRLCIADFSGEAIAKDTGEISNKSNLAAVVYWYIMQRMGNRESADRNAIREKKMGGENERSSGEAGKRSFMESYRKRAEFSVGELEEMMHVHRDYQGNAQLLAPGIDPAEVEKAVESAQFLTGAMIGEAQAYLFAWVYKRVASPHAVAYIAERDMILGEHGEIVRPLINAFGVMEAVLRYWGHPYLALLSTSYPIRQEGEMVIAPIDSRGQIPAELQAQINALYPYQGYTIKRSSNERFPEQNAVFVAIDKVVDDLLSNAWRCTAQESKIIEVFGKVQRRIKIYPSIKKEIAQLVIDIGSRKHYAPLKYSYNTDTETPSNLQL